MKQQQQAFIPFHLDMLIDHSNLTVMDRAVLEGGPRMLSLKAQSWTIAATFQFDVGILEAADGALDVRDGEWLSYKEYLSSKEVSLRIREGELL